MHVPDPESDIAQSRLARLAIAYLDAPNSPSGTALQSFDVFTEAMNDPRGEAIALRELTIAAVIGLANEWLSRAPRDGIVQFLRDGLVKLEAERDG